MNKNYSPEIYGAVANVCRRAPHYLRFGVKRFKRADGYVLAEYKIPAAHVRRNVALARAVFRRRTVPIDMVGRYVGYDRNVGFDDRAVKLKTGTVRTR